MKHSTIIKLIPRNNPPTYTQAHPNKKLAEQLHNEKPLFYKDDNHKPEMTIAITPFEALCSFQKINSVLENCRACPELVGVIGVSLRMTYYPRLTHKLTLYGY